ncbi:unnamed protein product [Linum trigynum]|uniref:Uncharacterized protein n=1 Tax=Linum trigynum TaxID=586398 RepID=A0AAV2CN14_9ROSI
MTFRCGIIEESPQKNPEPKSILDLLAIAKDERKSSCRELNSRSGSSGGMEEEEDAFGRTGTTTLPRNNSPSLPPRQPATAPPPDSGVEPDPAAASILFPSLRSAP